MYAVVPQFGDTKYFGFWVVLTEAAELFDKGFAPHRVEGTGDT
jgi:hypothetical protein